MWHFWAGSTTRGTKHKGKRCFRLLLLLLLLLDLLMMMTMFLLLLEIYCCTYLCQDHLTEELKLVLERVDPIMRFVQL